MMTTPTEAPREALARFLRSRREALDPQSVGFVLGRRRTPGLRREEVAQLAGVSATWYTWLEQAREVKPSRPVVERLSQALRLTPAERAHLHTLAGLSAPPPSVPASVDDRLLRLIDMVSPSPAYVINPWYDLLACNAAYAALMDLERRIAPERNCLWIAATDPGVQAMLPDWEVHLRPMLGQIRTNLARYPDDPRGPQLLDAILAASPKAAALWREQNVQRFEPLRKRLDHPLAGALEFESQKLEPTGGAGLSLLVYMPADEATAAGFRRLAESGHLFVAAPAPATAVV